MITLKINGSLAIAERAKEAVGICFGSIQNLKYWSHDALKKLYQGVFDMLYEYTITEDYESVKAAEKTVIIKFKKYCLDKKKYMPRDRDRLLAMIYEMILGAENKGILYGFGLRNNVFDGNFIGNNAEVNRMSKVK